MELTFNSVTRRMRQYDPTMTLTLRNRFVKEIERRFKRLTDGIKDKIKKQDFFGYHPQHFVFMAAGDDLISLDPVKVAQFIAWLREMVEQNILDVVPGPQLGSAIHPAWQGLYIQSWANEFVNEAYMRGLDRALAELRKAGYTPNNIDLQPGASLTELRTSSIHADRVGAIYTQLYSGFKGITADMDGKISNILALGMAQQTSVDELVDQLVKQVGLAARRASDIARTAIVRAYNWAAIQRYRNYGVLGINVMVEWITAGDDRVCGVCASMEGQTLTLDEAEKAIPVHLKCRCFCVPISMTDLGA